MVLPLQYKENPREEQQENKSAFNVRVYTQCFKLEREIEKAKNVTNKRTYKGKKCKEIMNPFGLIKIRGKIGIGKESFKRTTNRRR